MMSNEVRLCLEDSTYEERIPILWQKDAGDTLSGLMTDPELIKALW